MRSLLLDSFKARSGVLSRPGLSLFSTSQSGQGEALGGTSGTVDEHMVRRTYGVNGFLNKVPIFASLASETRFNAISKDVAAQAGLKVDPLPSTIILGDRSVAGCAGRVTTTWRFSNETPEDSDFEFIVLNDCCQPVILGMDFLMRTQTMTTNWHRLQTRDTPHESFSRVPLIGDATHSIAGTIDGRPTHALPAMGCDINIVSEAYVRSRNIEKKIRRDTIRLVKLADGTMRRTIGEINMTWGFGDERWLNRWPLSFSVLPDCLYDVVLGDDLLLRSNAFLQYEDCFRYTPPISSSGNRPIFKSGVGATPQVFLAFRRKLGVIGAMKATGDSSILTELKRRAAADHDISRLSPVNRSAAWQAEQTRREHWNSGVKSSDSSNDGAHVTSDETEKPDDTTSHSDLCPSKSDHAMLTGTRHKTSATEDFSADYDV